MQNPLVHDSILGDEESLTVEGGCDLAHGTSTAVHVDAHMNRALYGLGDTESSKRLAIVHARCKRACAKLSRLGARVETQSRVDPATEGGSAEFIDAEFARLKI